MGAEKIVKIDNDYEVDMLRERVSLLESVLDYSTAQTIDSLRLKNKQLETEAITLRAKDSEKDKLLAEKDKLITEIKNSINTKINFREEQLRREYDNKHKKSLIDMRKNIRQKEVKPKEEIIEKSKEEVDRIQNMYESLLKEFNQSHENETAILNMCSEILTTVKQLVSNGATPEEVIEKIDSSVESLKNLSIKDECEIIHNFIESGHSKKEVATYLYPDLARREQKVQERINSKQYQEMFGFFKIH